MNTNTQHTPGPWMVDATPAHCPCSFIVRHKASRCAAWVPLATCHTTADGDTAANARLIAAAPDLLAALREADKVLELAKGYFPKSIRDSDRFTLLNVQANSVRAAIAKASLAAAQNVEAP